MEYEMYLGSGRIEDFVEDDRLFEAIITLNEHQKQILHLEFNNYI